jgi:SAM-dependent methyltransferase/uncharacterized protein YbaR (Trm112 family)
MTGFAEDKFLDLFACPDCKRGFVMDGERLRCRAGHAFPIVRGVPRFVGSDGYVDSFSFEWNAHQTTQLDTFRRDRSSEDMFRRKTGLGPEDVRGKLVLDAGIGAGRFADIMSRWGAFVVGIDLSFAVEAAYANFRDRPNVVVAQADIARLPFADETFDIIVSIGVLHHTPDTKRHFEMLVPYLKHGGRIAIWVYPAEAQYRTRKYWIPFTSRIPRHMFYAWCRWFVGLAHRNPENIVVRVLDELFPISRQGLGLENDILDTFDAYSPRFHGTHTPTEVEAWFRQAGLVDIRNPGWDTSMTGVRP